MNFIIITKAIILLLTFCFTESQSVFAQDCDIIPVNSAIIEDVRLDHYLAELNYDTISKISISLIKFTTTAARVQKVNILDGYFTYVDKNTDLTKKMKCNESYAGLLNNLSRYYYYQNSKNCDEVEFLVLRENENMVIISSLSCYLYDYFFENCINHFNIEKKIIKSIRKAKIYNL